MKVVAALPVVLGLAFRGQGQQKAQEHGPATAMLFPSRISRCSAAKNGWNLIKLASIMFDEDAQMKGISHALDGQTWSMINNQPLTDEALVWPTGHCESLDNFVDGLLQTIVAGEADVDAIVDYIDGSIEFVDAEAMGISYERMARRYAGSALVSPHGIMVPSCMGSPVPKQLRGQVMDFGFVLDKVSKIFGKQHGCLSCLRNLIIDVGEIVTGFPLDAAVVENILDAFKAVGSRVQQTIADITEETMITNPADILRILLPTVIDTVKEYVGAGKEEAVLEFLGVVKDEMKSSSVAPIEERIQEYFHALGC